MFAFADKLPTSKSCAFLLPKEISREIAIRFEGWRVLEKKDLGSDDQILWAKAWGEGCPGVAVGNYDGSNEKGYAALIISQDSTKRQFKLLLLKKNSSGNYTIKTLIKSSGVGDYPVIYKGKPGTYTETGSFDYGKDNEADSVETKYDVIICEFIEKGALAFYYKDGKFHELVISD